MIDKVDQYGFKGYSVKRIVGLLLRSIGFHYQKSEWMIIDSKYNSIP